MRKISVSESALGISGVLSIPDTVCFAFNPNYIEFSLTGTDNTMAFYIAVGSFKFEVALFHGKAKSYISKALQTLFEDYTSVRSVKTTISVYAKVKGEESLIASFSTTAIWGALKIGDWFNDVQTYKYTPETPTLIRNLIWFKQFPFTVSLFREHTGIEIKASVDSGVATARGIFRYALQVDSDSLTAPASVSGVCPNVVNVIFYTMANVILALGDDGKFYTDWTASSNGMFGPKSAYYNGESIRTDVEYGDSSDATVIYRYYRDTEQMEESIVGCSGMSGLFEVNPSSSFSHAQRSLVYHIVPPSSFSTFDDTFDYTFFTPGDKDAYVNLTISNKKDGLYLRWIDQQGFIQYFLFDKGKITTKTTLSKSTIEDDVEYQGRFYVNSQRVNHIEGTTTVFCCATNMPAEIYNYVETILVSPHIDLYLGKTAQGRDVWVPVNIASTNVSKDAKKVLQDLEFSFTLPDSNAQTL